MTPPLSGKRALVLGAAHGVGLACANELAAHGASVTAVYRARPPDFAQAEVDRQAGLEWICADQTTERGFETIMSACPDPDILVIVPPRVPLGSGLDINLDAYRVAHESNCIAPLRFVLGMAPRMRAQRFGRIVAISGASTKAPIPSHAAVNAARVALLAAISGIAREIASSNVTINAVLLGPTDTPGLVERWQARAQERGIPYEQLFDESCARIPSGRLGRPQECAALCMLLCSPAMGHLTAQNILLDGGATPGLF